MLAAKVVGSLGFHTIFLMHIQSVYTMFVRCRNPIWPLPLTIDGFGQRHLLMDGPETEGSWGYFVKEGVYGVTIALAER
jgi:hypothetical protein